MRYVHDNLEENIPHGDSMFQFHLYEDKKINPLMDLYTHWHEEVEIVYVQEGSFTFIINGHEYIATAGDCFIINSHELHQAYVYQQYYSIHYALVFHLDMLKSYQFDSCQFKYMEPILKGQLLFPTYLSASSPSHSLIVSQLELIRHYATALPNGWEFGIKASLFQIVAHLLMNDLMIAQEVLKPSLHNVKLNLVKESLQLIHKHYQDKLLVTDIASHLNITTEYYSRIFKLYLGKPPIEYLNDYRIDQATKLLTTTKLSVLEIALDCGFDNISYFIRRFKSQKGMTPKKFRDTYGNL